MRYSTLPCAKKRVRESELVVFNKFQQAFAVIVTLITSERSMHLTVTTPVHPVRTLASTGTNRHSFVGIRSNMCFQYSPFSCVLGLASVGA